MKLKINMKTLLMLIACCLAANVFSGCFSYGAASTDGLNAQQAGSDQEILESPSPTLEISKSDDAQITKIASALLGAGLLGQSWTSSDFESIKEDVMDYGGFAAFYCMMEQDCLSEIPADVYEACIENYFGISKDELRKSSNYDSDNNAYTISVDISVDMMRARIDDFFRITSIEAMDGQIKVFYKILWGKMASSGDGSDSAFEGYIVLQDNNAFFRIQSVVVTADYSNKYDN